MAHQSLSNQLVNTNVSTRAGQELICDQPISIFSDNQLGGTTVQSILERLNFGPVDFIPLPTWNNEVNPLNAWKEVLRNRPMIGSPSVAIFFPPPMSSRNCLAATSILLDQNRTTSLFMQLPDFEDSTNPALTFLQLQERGLKGATLFQDDFDQCVEGIRKVAEGKIFMSDSLTHAVLSFATSALSASEHDRLISGRHVFKLTTTELRILNIMYEDPSISNKALASRLGIKLYTVKNHMKGILHKLHVTSRHEALQKALDNGLFRLSTVA